MIGTGANPPSSAQAYQGALEYSRKAAIAYQSKNLTSGGGG